MTAQNQNDLKQGVVQDMRKIREQISFEIKDMTFEEERAYLDKLLSEKKTTSSKSALDKSAATGQTIG